MSLSQPFVFRMFFNSESDAKAAVKHLAEFEPDYVSGSSTDPARWKVVFYSEDMEKANAAIVALSQKTLVADYWDPKTGWGIDANGVNNMEYTVLYSRQ